MNSIDDLTPAPYNATLRVMDDEAKKGLRYSLDKFGDISGITYNERTGNLVCAHQRLEQLREMGARYDAGRLITPKGDEFRVRVVDWDLATEMEANLAANNGCIAGGFALDSKEAAAHVDGVLAGLPDAEKALSGLKALRNTMRQPGIDDNVENYTDEPVPLAEQFGAPPFSILDLKQGYWMDRKRYWKDRGVCGEQGRSSTVMGRHRTSVMDPAVCELMYSWFCPSEGVVVNPTAGESVYGLVAAARGYRYVGVEVRQEQIDANTLQARRMGLSPEPKWIHGDGRDVSKLAPKSDLIICCPPYYDLEVYSSQDDDISAMKSYDEFLDAYFQIIKGCVEVMNQDSFAVFIVGEIRDKKGIYRNFVGDTVSGFLNAGAVFYNEIIEATPLDTLRIRAARPFRATRKIGKAHQNILVFAKGDPVTAARKCGDVEVADAGDE